MKTTICSLLILSAFVFVRCSGGKPETVSAEKKTIVAYSLSPENIYRPNCVDTALKAASAIQKAESRRLFMTGLDLLANKNDATSSIEYFKEAIYYYPDEKNYLHLFNAYLKSNQPALADSVNSTLYYRAEAGQVTFADVSFNSALIFAARKDTSGCIEYLLDAVQQGFAFKDRVTEEKLFEFLKENQSFQSLLVTHFGDDEKIKAVLFKAFLKSVPELALPYEMVSDSARVFNFDKYIDYDFALFVPGMENSRFSRDVSNEYMIVGKFRTPNGTGFIYKSYQVIADTLNPVTVNVILYDSLGAVVSQREIGCFCSPLENSGFKLTEDLRLEITTYKINWESDPIEKGYAGNKIVSKEQSGLNIYLISKENTIEESTAPQPPVASDH